MKSIHELAVSLLMLSEQLEGNEASQKATQEIFEHLKPLLNAGYIMRKYQKQYFQNKDERSLQAAKKWEREFDTLLNQLIHEKQNPKIL